MLYFVNDQTDPYSKYLEDDPVRPDIGLEERFGVNRKVFVLTDELVVEAVVCVKLCNLVPDCEQQLLNNETDSPTTAVFYTIWSYRPGSGQRLIMQTLDYLKKENKEITKFVTLSPMTEMAKKFHLRNGASVLRVNQDTINYEYQTA
jgi:hypothetical protein